MCIVHVIIEVWQALNGWVASSVMHAIDVKFNTMCYTPIQLIFCLFLQYFIATVTVMTEISSSWLFVIWNLVQPFCHQLLETKGNSSEDDRERNRAHERYDFVLFGIALDQVAHRSNGKTQAGDHGKQWNEYYST